MGNFDQEKEVQDASELHQHAVVEEKELKEKRSELDGYTYFSLRVKLSLHTCIISSQYQSKIESSKRQLDELDRQVDSAVLKNSKGEQCDFDGKWKFCSNTWADCDRD